MLVNFFIIAGFYLGLLTCIILLIQNKTKLFFTISFYATAVLMLLVISSSTLFEHLGIYEHTISKSRQFFFISFVATALGSYVLISYLHHKSSVKKLGSCNSKPALLDLIIYGYNEYNKKAKMCASKVNKERGDHPTSTGIKAESATERGENSSKQESKIEKSERISHEQLSEFFSHQDYILKLRKESGLETDHISELFHEFIYQFFDKDKASLTLRQINRDANYMETLYSTRKKKPGNIPVGVKSLIQRSLELGFKPLLFSQNKEWHFSTYMSKFSEWKYIDYICMCIDDFEGKPVTSICLDITDKSYLPKLVDLVKSGCFQRFALAIKQMMYQITLTELNNHSQHSSQNLQEIKK